MKTIASKIAEIMLEVRGVNKTGFNAHFKYKFVEAARVAELIREAMASRKLAMFPVVTSYDRKGEMTVLHVQYTIVDGETGESMTMQTVGEALDKGDKASNKCLTSALKYALIQLFLLPTGDDVESDDETDQAPASGSVRAPQQVSARQSPPQEPPAQPKQEPQGPSPYEQIVEIAKSFGKTETEAKSAIKGATTKTNASQLVQADVEIVRKAMQFAYGK